MLHSLSHLLITTVALESFEAQSNLGGYVRRIRVCSQDSAKHRCRSNFARCSRG